MQEKEKLKNLSVNDLTALIAKRAQNQEGIKMSDTNQVQLSGRVLQDPVVFTTKTGKKKTTFKLKNTFVPEFKGVPMTPIESTLDVFVWNDNNQLQKNDQLVILGRLVSREVVSKNTGRAFNVVEVKAEVVKKEVYTEAPKNFATDAPPDHDDTDFPFGESARSGAF